MPETLEQRTKETLRSYVREVKSLPNEAAKRSRFAALIGELFPGTHAIAEYARGVEKLIRISRPEERRRDGPTLITATQSLSLRNRSQPRSLRPRSNYGST